MRNITILGAGKSSIALIDYLIEHAPKEEWEISVADITEELALQKTRNRAHTKALGFNLNDEAGRRELLSQTDIVISMLPAAFHITIAGDCLALKKHLITPSYISGAMQELNDEVAHNGLIFMNEMGLDPGIDHMSALQIINRLKSEGAQITSFKSHCGGLIAPESDGNPWHYKFTWNPRNVILAGQGTGGIKYRKNNELIELSYEQLFGSAEKLSIEGYGEFESYPNRDSLKYIETYGLNGVETMYRGTLRIPPFCAGWNQLVKAGLTDDTLIHDGLDKITFTSFFEMKWDEYFAGLDLSMRGLLFDIFDYNYLIPFKSATNAQVLQALLENQWVMEPGDKDMVVMVHEFEYLEEGKKQKLQSSLVVKGKDEEHTAMAITVGLPVAMAAKMILNNQINQRGVLMPGFAEIYNPILAELKEFGIAFTEKHS